MARLVLALAASALAAPPLASGPWGPRNPVANTASIHEDGDIRITLLSPRLVRIEQAEDGAFEDRATQAVVNRYGDAPKVVVSAENGATTITTEFLNITYDKDLSTLEIRSTDGKFEPYRRPGRESKRAAVDADVTNRGDAAVERRETSAETAWRRRYAFGQAQSAGNLLGTMRTLDQQDHTLPLNCTILETDWGNTCDEADCQCEWAVFSKTDGWARAPRGTMPDRGSRRDGGRGGAATDQRRRPRRCRHGSRR